MSDGDDLFVVIGWAGASTRQLRGVSKFYEAQSGGAPLTIRPRTVRAMALPWGWSDEGALLAEQLLARDPRSVFVHSFSNAGFWTYAATLRALERSRAGRALRDRIRAVVFDSAPGFPDRFEAGFTARYSAMAMMPLLLRSLGRPPALTHPLFDRPLRNFMRFWYHVSPRQIREAQESLDIVGATGRWPFLFLYSTADTLCLAPYIDAFIERSRATARPVRALRWTDSEHVRHLVVHRGEYFASIRELLCELNAGVTGE